MMMSCSADFEGTIAVDGIVRSRGVRVWITDTILDVSEVSRFGLCRFKIYLKPFGQSMILTRNAKCMREGLFFDFKGNSLGTVIEGPLGHPGDGEFNNWQIIAFRTTVTYFVDRIEVWLDGQTTSGIGAYDVKKALRARNFSVHFAIPKERIAEFFQLEELAHSDLLKAFAQAFP